MTAHIHPVAASAPKPPPVALLCALGMLCTLVSVVFARLAFGLVLPAMRADLGLSYAQAANMGTVTAMGYLGLLLYAGVFAGRYGSKRAILVGLSFALAGFAGSSVGSNYIWLMCCMGLLGFGTAFTFTPLVSLLGAWYPTKRAAVIGFANSGVGVGILVSGMLVPWMIDTLGTTGWRWVWAVFAGSALTTGLLVALWLRDPPRPAAASSVLQGLRTVYRSPHVMIIGLIYGVVGLTYIVQTIFMFSFALDSGVDALTAGKLVSIMGILSIFAGPAWGWAADRIGHAGALMACMMLSFVGTALPVVWQQTPAFLIHYVFMGLSVSGLFTSILASSTTTVKPQHAPMAVSFVTLFFALGQLIGPAIAGALIDWQQDFRLTFAISSAILLVGAALSGYSSRLLQLQQRPGV